MQSIIQTLVHARHDIPFPPTDITNPRHLPRHVITDAKPSKIPFPMQLVHCVQRNLKIRRPIRTMQVPHVHVIRLECHQAIHEVLP